MRGPARGSGWRRWSRIRRICWWCRDAPAFPSLATAVLDHPATAFIPRRRFDPAALICGGPQTAAAVAMLDDERLAMKWRR